MTESTASSIIDLSEFEGMTTEQLIDQLEENFGLILEQAWGLIANAYGGNWEDAPAEWKEAAEVWRDGYFTVWLQKGD